MYDQWLSFVQQNIFEHKLAREFPRQKDFHVKAMGRSVDDWAVSRIITTAGKSQLVRDGREISAHPRARYMAYLSLRDDIEFEQFNRTAKCQRASLTLVSGSDPLIHSKLGDNDTLCLGMPSEFVEQRYPQAEQLCAVRLSTDGGIGSLVQDSFLALHREAAKMPPEEFRSAARIVGDLILLALGGNANPSTSTSFVRISNLARAKRIVRARLSEPGLSPGDVAMECSISVSYLHNLFRDDGRTFREYLVSERLQQARAMLATGSTNSITAVAMACGFPNMSAFSTMFRRTFFASPREFARAGLASVT
jgi:AraC-like DNA-binding protein